jgi:peroxiredoxin
MGVLLELFNDAKFIVQYRRKKMGIQKNLDRHAPKVGDTAPDFTLFDVDGKESVTLSHFRGEKPVALIFGSYT